jgi:hypothetical protein
LFHETIQRKLYITNHWILQIQEDLDWSGGKNQIDNEIELLFFRKQKQTKLHWEA